MYRSPPVAPVLLAAVGCEVTVCVSGRALNWIIAFNVETDLANQLTKIDTGECPGTSPWGWGLCDFHRADGPWLQ
jgi:hypothetical protein